MMTQSMNYLTSDGETSSASKINPNARQPQEEEDDEDWCWITESDIASKRGHESLGIGASDIGAMTNW